MPLRPNLAVLILFMISVPSLFALSSVYLSPIIARAIDKAGVFHAFIVLLIVIVPIILISSVVLYILESKQLTVENNEKSDNVLVENQNIFKTKKFWEIFIIYFAGTLSGMQISGHIAHIAFLQAGLLYTTGLVSGYSIGGMLGRVTSGFVSGRIPHTIYLSVIFFVNAANMLLFRWYSSLAILMIGILIAGYVQGSSMVIIPQIIAEQYKGDLFSSVMGVVALASGLAGFLGPSMSGMVIDITGNYNCAYLFCSVVMLCALCVSIIMYFQNKGQSISGINDYS